MHGEKNRPAKWNRQDYQLFMVEWSSYTLGEVKQAIAAQNHGILMDICDDIASEICSRIRNRDLRLAPIKFFKRVDGISGKEREISHESVIQQIMDAVAVAALMPLFKAKIMPRPDFPARKAQFYPRRYMAAAQSPAYAAPCAKRHKLLRLF